MEREGRDFSRAVNYAESMRLQPLRFRSSNPAQSRLRRIERKSSYFNSITASPYVGNVMVSSPFRISRRSGGASSVALRSS